MRGTAQRQYQSPPLSATLRNYLQNLAVFHCPEDQTLYPVEHTSYDWNMFLNGAPYDHPEDCGPRPPEHW